MIPRPSHDPIVTKKIQTRKEAFYCYLSVFGCRAFVYIPRDKIFKFDKRSKQCMFIGYGHEEFGYRLWNLDDKKFSEVN